MAKEVTLSINLPADVARELEIAAANRGISPSALATDSVIHHLESANRYRFMLERMEAVDQALIDLAGFIGESVPKEPFDFSSICAYVPPGKL
jgi:hypothetical protein